MTSVLTGKGLPRPLHEPAPTFLDTRYLGPEVPSVPLAHPCRAFEQRLLKRIPVPNAALPYPNPHNAPFQTDNRLCRAFLGSPYEIQLSLIHFGVPKNPILTFAHFEALADYHLRPRWTVSRCAVLAQGHLNMYSLGIVWSCPCNKKHRSNCSPATHDTAVFMRVMLLSNPQRKTLSATSDPSTLKVLSPVPQAT